jgi:hypothetical protein
MATATATEFVADAGRRKGWRAVSLQLRVWAGSAELDRRLAEGVLPTRSPELALRARQLSAARSRQALAAALTGAIETAARPGGPRLSPNPLAAAGVREAAAPLASLAGDLVTVGEPRVRGLALASFLVCDPGSPLYDSASPVSVRELADRARTALQPA